jgi:dihydroorotase
MSTSGTLLITGGRLLDPKNGVDTEIDLLIENGVVVDRVAPGQGPKSALRVDAKDRWVLPGFVDLRARLKDQHDVRAALAGGYTTVVASPESELKSTAELNLLHAAPLTKGLAGEELGEVSDTAACLSNGSKPVVRAGLMRRALQYARPLKNVVMVHSEDPSLSGRGVLGEGLVASHLGLPAVPASAEVSMVARDLSLFEEIGGRLHFSHLTCEGSMRLIRDAKARGLLVTCDVTPIHVSRSDEAAKGYSLAARVWPPLRPAHHVHALIDALRDDTVDAFATDHLRTDPTEREHPFDMCTPGEPLLSTAWRLAMQLKLPPMQLAKLFTHGPAAVLGLDIGHLSNGARGDVTIVNPKTLEVHYTLVGGNVRYSRGEA